MNSMRAGGILALLLALTALVYYGYLHYPGITLRMCVEDPLRYDGRAIGVGTETTVAALFADGFLIHHMGDTFRVLGDPGDAEPGDFIQMRAVFHCEGYLELQRLHVAKYRRLKIIVSIAPVVLVAFLFLKHYRFNWGRCLFYEA